MRTGQESQRTVWSGGDLHSAVAGCPCEVVWMLRLEFCQHVMKEKKEEKE